MGVGDDIAQHDRVGALQTLQNRYPGITDHTHLDLKREGRWVDPTPFFNLA